MGERGRIFYLCFLHSRELAVSIGSFSNGDDNGVDGCPQNARRSRSSKISARLYAPQAKRVEPLSDCRLGFQA